MEHVLCVCVCKCACVSLWVPVCMFVFTKASHIPRLSAAPQHTQTGVRTGGSASPDSGAWPRWANIPLSQFLSPLSAVSLIQCLPLSCSLCILTFPLCQAQRASLLFRVGNATGAKSALVSVWYHPAFVLAVSYHHAIGLRRHQPDTWEQAGRRQDRSHDVLVVCLQV